MKARSGLTSIILSFLIFPYVVTASQSIVIRSHNSVKDGDAVPIIINISPPLRQGNRLAVLYKGNDVVQLEAYGDVEVESFGFRFRAMAIMFKS